MYAVLIFLHVLICMMVILIVLVQSGRGAGFSGLFGGGGGDALFSAPSGSSFLRKLTTGLATGFFLTSLFLTYLSARRGIHSVTRGAWPVSRPAPLENAVPPRTEPAAPAAAPKTDSKA